MPSLEPEKSSTEQLKDQLSDQQRVIFDFLRANPDRAFTYREIGDALDMHKQTVRKHLVERGMTDERYRMNGTSFDGIVTHERDENAKCWFIRSEVDERLDEPPVREKIIEREVPQYVEMADFVDEHYELVSPFIFVAVIGFILKALEWVDLGVFADVGMMLFGAGLAGLGTIALIAYRETTQKG